MYFLSSEIMDNDELVNKIEDWINNDSLKRLIVTRELYDPTKFPFLLKIKPTHPTTQEVPMSIFKPRDYKDRISVYSNIKFDEEQKNSWKITDSSFKDEVMTELSQGLFMMSLVTRFHPNQNNLEQIIFQDMIYFDGLSKDRIMNSITRIVAGYSYMVAILVKHKILRKKFDPSDYIYVSSTCHL
jgi:hypothetical protein